VEVSQSSLDEVVLGGHRISMSPAAWCIRVGCEQMKGLIDQNFSGVSFALHIGQRVWILQSR
jgi:hypothetical protein